MQSDCKLAMPRPLKPGSPEFAIAKIVERYDLVDIDPVLYPTPSHTAKRAGALLQCFDYLRTRPADADFRVLSELAARIPRGRKGRSRRVVVQAEAVGHPGPQPRVWSAADADKHGPKRITNPFTYAFNTPWLQPALWTEILQGWQPREIAAEIDERDRKRAQNRIRTQRCRARLARKAG
jgi:hypothetical protein